MTLDVKDYYSPGKLPNMVFGEKIRIGYILRKLMCVAYLRAFSNDHKITFDCFMKPGDDPADELHQYLCFQIDDVGEHMSKQEFKNIISPTLENPRPDMENLSNIKYISKAIGAKLKF